jgi:hypothetical protein
MAVSFVLDGIPWEDVFRAITDGSIGLAWEEMVMSVDSMIA